MKIVESLAEKYIQKGMHLGDNDPEKGVFGERMGYMKINI